MASSWVRNGAGMEVTFICPASVSMLTQTIWILPLTFPLVMAFSGFLGLLGVGLPGVEIGIAASAVLLGAAVMTERRLPLFAAAVLVAFFAVFHGHAHGTELPAGQSGLLYSLGVLMHLSTRLRYHNALWHLFVLVAAGCHFVAVYRLVLSQQA